MRVEVVAQPAADLQPVEVGQPEVEQDHVVVTRPAFSSASWPVRGLVDGVARPPRSAELHRAAAGRARRRRPTGACPAAWARVRAPWRVRGAGAGRCGIESGLSLRSRPGLDSSPWTNRLPGTIGRCRSLPDETLRLERALLEVKRVSSVRTGWSSGCSCRCWPSGHCLIEGVPGVAKTLAARTLADVVGGTFARMQFTPDLVPADIVGTRVYHPSTETFAIEPGPIVSPTWCWRTRSTGRRRRCSRRCSRPWPSSRCRSAAGRPSCPTRSWCWRRRTPSSPTASTTLPEAQRDRFLMRVVVELPSDDGGASHPRPGGDPGPAGPAGARPGGGRADAEGRGRRVRPRRGRGLRRTPGGSHPGPGPARRRRPGGAARSAVRARARRSSLVAGARALALLRGREYVLPQDVADLAVDVIAHRLMLTFDALADGVDAARTRRGDRGAHAGPRGVTCAGRGGPA